MVKFVPMSVQPFRQGPVIPTGDVVVEGHAGSEAMRTGWMIYLAGGWSASLYPRDFTEMMASFSRGIFNLRRRI